MDALGVLTPIGRHRQPVMDGDPLDDEHLVLCLDLPHGLRLEVIGLDFDLTRLQRACERSCQSAAGRSDDIVQRRRVRRELLRRDAVVRGHFGVDTEADRLLLGRKVRQALRSAQPLDSNP